MGEDVDAAFETLAVARGPRCPETDPQRAFIQRFADSLASAPIVRTTPSAHSARETARLSPRASSFAGAVLGAAIGDAIGHPTEFIRSVTAIQQKFGPRGVEGYELYWERDGRRFAPYTDDTQMAESVLRALLMARAAREDLDATMRRMAESFISWANHPHGGHRAPGNACLAGARALESGTHWSRAGGEAAGGCGSVMRAYPFGLVFMNDLARAERWAVAHSALTHRDPIALAACAAMAVGTALAATGAAKNVVTSEMIAAACRHSPSTAAMMAAALDEAARGVKPDVTLDRLEGWAAHEAIAAAIYVFARHADDPRAAILEAANTKGDSDSIATLAGALVGARCGLGALPAAWVRDIERSDELFALAMATNQMAER
jgi:ADP-ribosylglycohydrolase